MKLFLDTADPTEIDRAGLLHPVIEGFTTNPTLARAAGVTDYLEWARTALYAAGTLPVSLEVIADNIETMHDQALRLSELAPNAVVKIPIMNTHGESCLGLVKQLSDIDVTVNVTAVMTSAQAEAALDAMRGGYVSIFAGRIGDHGGNYLRTISRALAMANRGTEIIWASTREAHNVDEARRICCDAITVTPAIHQKLATRESDLVKVSHATVEMFYRDAVAAGFEL